LIGLALVAVVFYQGSPQLPKGAEFNWETMKQLGFWGAVWGPLKRDWFQTLMHIAVTSLWILPVIRAGTAWRVVYLIVSALIHMGLSQAFCMEWVNRDPSGVDGGPLAFLTWSISAIVGTLAGDLVMSSRTKFRILGSLLCSGLFLIALGWIVSWATRCYDVADDQVAALQAQRLAASPVIPLRADWVRWSSNLKNGHWPKVLAEPPFVPPPHSHDANGDKNYDYRKWNYWMMSTRFVTISYAVFVSGLSLVLYGIFHRDFGSRWIVDRRISDARLQRALRLCAARHRWRCGAQIPSSRCASGRYVDLFCRVFLNLLAVHPQP
jgi:hypothetical protein